jgi:membrane protease YdiL (CAAX protease family)
MLSSSLILLYLAGPILLSIGLIAGAGSQAFDRRIRGASYAGPSPLLVFGASLAVTMATGAVFGIALDLVFGALAIGPPIYVVRLIGVTLQALVFVGVIRLLVVGTGALSWAEMGWTRLDGRALSGLVNGAAFAVPVIAVTLVIATILVTLFRVISPSPLPPTGVVTGILVQLVAGAIVAPVAEEAMFRGFTLTAWRRTRPESQAIVLSAVLFALAHVITVSASSFPEAIGLIVVGAGTRIPVALVLGWLFIRTRSIWAPIGLHVAFNAILLILSEAAPRPV